MATDPELDKENPNYNAIRHFKGTWKNFEEFWKEKGARMSPWEEWDEEYPEKKKRINKNPIQMYKTFDDESDVDENEETDILHNPSKGLGVKVGNELITRKIPTRKEALSLEVGDQVVDKSRESLGVGTINSFSKDKKTAQVQFYDTLQGSAMDISGDEYKVDTNNLFAVIADDNSYQFNESKVEQSAGVAIVFGDKVLLGHMTKRKWWGGYTIPKGHLDGKETIPQAALRETFEEVGIRIPKNLMPSKYQTCPYVKKGKGHYKDVHYYTIVIDSLDQLGLKDEVIPKSQLQLEEVDWAGFIPIKEALKRISPVMKPIIESLMIYNNNAFKTFEQFKESLDEENILALGGSQQDSPPMSKPFVLKTKKKRAGGNDDDEEDETEEVANVNTVGIGTK